MLAVSGGARFGTVGRGDRYFKRQWDSHYPERPFAYSAPRRGFGTLKYVCEQAGMTRSHTVSWEADFERQRKELSEFEQFVDPDIFEGSTK
jgi:hypothetical protein